jgi:type II secretory pathway pseudopilin PulG
MFTHKTPCGASEHHRGAAFRNTLASESGAVDLGSVMVGVMVIGFVMAVLATTLFAVVPWSHDRAAQGSLESVRTAQTVAYVTEGHYLSVPLLRENGYLQKDDGEATPGANTGVAPANFVTASTPSPTPTANPKLFLWSIVGDLGGCYAAAAKSITGTIYFISSETPGMSVYVHGVSESTCLDLAAIAEMLEAQPPLVAVKPYDDGVVGEIYSDTINVNSATEVTIEVTSGNLPPGLTLDPVTGSITGTPTVVGSETFEVTVTNDGGSETIELTINITGKDTPGYDVEILGDASAFSVFSYAALTGAGASTITGRVGTSASSPETTGQIAAAYTELVSRPYTELIDGDLIGRTLTPGVYYSGAALTNTGTLTFDGQGDRDSVFIIQIDAALNSAAASKVVLTNGAKFSNIFWVVNGAATLGASSNFFGTIITTYAITVGAGTHVTGRTLAYQAAITLDDNLIDGVPPHAWETPDAPMNASGGFSVFGGSPVTGVSGSSIAGQVGDTAANPDVAAEISDLHATLRAKPYTSMLSGDLTGRTLKAGVHYASAALANTDTLTFDGEGNPDSVFIIQVDAAVNTAAGSRAVLINGANASNIFWVVEGAVTLGANSVFVGNIISRGAITVGATSTVEGRALTTNGAVTLDGSTFVFGS